MAAITVERASELVSSLREIDPRAAIDLYSHFIGDVFQLRDPIFAPMCGLDLTEVVEWINQREEDADDAD